MSARSTGRESSTHSRTDWRRLRRPGDRDIDFSDIPETSPDFWADAKLVLPGEKVPVSLRLDRDVVEWFKAQGPGYQTRMNAVLRLYARRHAAHGAPASGQGAAARPRRRA